MEIDQNEMNEQMKLRVDSINHLRQENDKLSFLNAEYAKDLKRLELTLQKVNDDFLQLQESHRIYKSMLDFQLNDSPHDRNEFANSILERCMQGQ